MDHRPQQVQEVSLDRVRESLIAISYCEPERFSHVTQPEISNGEKHNVAETKVESNVDELRSKLISIASDSPSMDCGGNNCNGYGHV